MTIDTERLSEVLHRAAPVQAPGPELFGLAARARDRAAEIRTRRRLTIAGVAAAVALAVAVPVFVGAGRGSPPVGPAPTGPSSHGSTKLSAIAAAVRKPLTLPRLGPGEACPVGTATRFPAGAGFSSSFQAFGPGPFYLTGSGSVQVRPPVHGWREQKVIWVVARSYNGPLLLRGGRVDGAGRLQFLNYLGAAGHGRTGSVLYVRAGLDAPSPDPGAIQSYPSEVFVTSPGCYAIQADGVGFSERLYFEATAGR